MVILFIERNKYKVKKNIIYLTCCEIEHYLKWQTFNSTQLTMLSLISYIFFQIHSHNYKDDPITTIYLA